MICKIRILTSFCFLSMLVGTFMFVLSCDQHIIQRAASDYFRYEPGNWWHLAGTDDTIYVEVEPVDTINQTEVIPVAYNGNARFVFEADEALYEYISIVYTFAGSEYSVIDDFSARIEFPLVNGNTWQDSLIGSVEVSGQSVNARYEVHGSITNCQYSETYDGDVYTIEILTRTLFVTPDTSIVDSSMILEEFAPGIGIVRVRDQTGDYVLSDYLVQ
jgi:hypothetical protein